MPLLLFLTKSSYVIAREWTISKDSMDWFEESPNVIGMDLVDAISFMSWGL